MSSLSIFFVLIVTMVTAHAQSLSQRRDACNAKAKYVCMFMPTEGYNIKGFVKITPSWSLRAVGGFGCHVRIQAEMSGLSPGKHGFHIHTYGDVRSSDGTSTGGHFTNPEGVEVPHGFNSNQRRHWGDLDNIIADGNGVASYNRVDRLIMLESLLGRGLTVHAAEDRGPNYQPTGDAGARVAMCVIGHANPEYVE